MKMINSPVRTTSPDFLLGGLPVQNCIAEVKRICRRRERARLNAHLLRCDPMRELRELRQDQAVRPPRLKLVRSPALQVERPTPATELGNWQRDAAGLGRHLAFANGMLVACAA